MYMSPGYSTCLWDTDQRLKAASEAKYSKQYVQYKMIFFCFVGQTLAAHRLVPISNQTDVGSESYPWFVPSWQWPVVVVAKGDDSGSGGWQTEIMNYENLSSQN